MKISSSTPNYMAYTNPANQASQTEAAVTNKEKPADGSKTDSINLSAKTMDLQKISTAMDTEPLDRKKMVADIKQQVDAGQYTIDAKMVAGKMLGNMIDVPS
jgi:flagellar biosynthesis anti-sigma factor FlgM